MTYIIRRKIQNKSKYSLIILFIQDQKKALNHYNNCQAQFFGCLLALFLAGRSSFYLGKGLLGLIISVAISDAILLKGKVILGLSS